MHNVRLVTVGTGYELRMYNQYDMNNEPGPGPRVLDPLLFSSLLVTSQAYVYVWPPGGGAHEISRRRHYFTSAMDGCAGMNKTTARSRRNIAGVLLFSLEDELYLVSGPASL